MRYYHHTGQWLDVIEPLQLQVQQFSHELRPVNWRVCCMILYFGAVRAWFELRTCETREEAIDLMKLGDVGDICDRRWSDARTVGDAIPTIADIHRRLRR